MNRTAGTCWASGSYGPYPPLRATQPRHPAPAPPLRTRLAAAGRLPVGDGEVNGGHAPIPVRRLGFHGYGPQPAEAVLIPNGRWFLPGGIGDVADGLACLVVQSTSA